MKILILNDERWDSGITGYFLKVASLLAENGDEVVLGVRPESKSEKQAKKLSLKTESVSNFFDVRRLLKAHQWDLINVHTGRTHSWTVLAQKTLSQNKRRPVVRTRGDAKPLKIHPLSRYIYKQTTAVITASDHIRNQYEIGYGFNEEQLRTIYPSVSPPSMSSPLPIFRVGILGRLDPVKGHTFFLEAASQVLKEIPMVQFFVAGKEANLSVALLKNHAQQLGIESSVHFLGFHPSAADFVKSCTVGVISSIGSEEVSRVCLEWMAGGRPVVGTLVGCLSELIEPGETGLIVSPNDSITLGKAILRILRNSDLASRWGQNARNVIDRRFSPEIQLEKTVHLFKWALQQHG
ncbi:hypothetical protein BVX98_02705 [bacterium F11]|nr:hypothetical protein BVX98_02705 [bacterium F11]